MNGCESLGEWRDSYVLPHMRDVAELLCHARNFFLIKALLSKERFHASNVPFDIEQLRCGFPAVIATGHTWRGRRGNQNAPL
jgi:hypothetical protein